MDLVSLAIFLGIGALAGFLAGQIMKGQGFGLLSNIIIGIIGAVIGGYVFGLLGISAGGMIGSLITAVAGAVILLFLVRLFKKM
ncbi:MAG: GlsB/YeaQ/YmgE family stress response membrane protein [Pseudomonadota bacterium]|nr:GlsB/YeaQ/YmgE family stress response membrane protein [Pseudomonadota bacterium]